MMNEYISAVTHLIGEVKESTDRGMALSSVFAGSFIIPFYLFKEQPDLTIVTGLILVFMWMYAAVGLCFVLFTIERLCEQVVDDS